jgi:probable F420-dependent oxidoreductase
MRPFRFGLTTGWVSTADAWSAMARRAEALGYDVLLVPDHLGGQLSPLAALASAAAVTTRIRIGSNVFANDFRHPLVLAREAATLDVLSNGRLEFGIGAGWRVSDYTQLGVPYDPAGRRIDRMEEAVTIIKRLFAGETVTVAGDHYRLRGARLSPRTVQRPRPPILLGGGGPRMLRIAAREADIVGFVPQFSAAGRPIIRQATEGIPEGPIVGKVPRLIKPAAGETYHAIESPKGELGYFIVSDGKSTNPYRFRVRPPSFCNLQALRPLIKGHLIADVVALIGSLDAVLGEVDR